MFMAADFYNRRLFNDLFFVRYRGESEDRLRCLAQELFDTVLRPSIFPGAYELIDKSRQLGLRQVLVTGALDITVGPLAKHLGIDDYVTNRLEFVNGYATGRLLPPVMAAATKASWMRIYAEKENLSLCDSYAYTDSMSDLPMLSIVGHPTAVNPDMRLRKRRCSTTGRYWICDDGSRCENERPRFFAVRCRATRKTTRSSTSTATSAPRIMSSGEDFILEDLPIGTRVLYPEAADRRACRTRGRDPLRAEPPARTAIRCTRSSSPG